MNPNRTRRQAKTPPHFPTAYFISFSCYGTWLHGDERGSIDRFHNTTNTPLLPPNPARLAREKSAMKSKAMEMSSCQRDAVLRAVQTVCLHRKWVLIAAHVRSKHVHVVVNAPNVPEKVMNDFKAYATRMLRKAGMIPGEGKTWARHGSTKYLWNRSAVSAAVNYVVHEQGEQMAVFCGEEWK